MPVSFLPFNLSTLLICMCSLGCTIGRAWLKVGSFIAGDVLILLPEAMLFKVEGVLIS